MKTDSFLLTIFMSIMSLNCLIEDITVRNEKNLFKAKQENENNIKQMKKTSQNIEKIYDYISTFNEERKQLKEEIKSMDKKQFDDNLRKKLYNFNNEKDAVTALKKMNYDLETLQKNQEKMLIINHRLVQEKELRDAILQRIKTVNHIALNAKKTKETLQIEFIDRIDEMIINVTKLEDVNRRIKDGLYLIENNITSIGENPVEILKKIARKEEKKCIDRASCTLCLEDTECIWCGLTNQCVQGNINGSYDQSCKESFFALKCVDRICSHFKNCEDCIYNKDCGWCGDYERCLEGDKINPYKMKCENYFHKVNRVCEISKFLQ